MGEAAWVNAPRAVLLAVPPPDVDPRQSPERLLALEKSNLSPYPWPPALSFRLAPHPVEPALAVIEWGPEVPGVTPDAMLARQRQARGRSPPSLVAAFSLVALIGRRQRVL